MGHYLMSVHFKTICVSHSPITCLMRGLVRALLTTLSVSTVVLVLAESSDRGESSARLTLRRVWGLVSDLKQKMMP